MKTFLINEFFFFKESLLLTREQAMVIEEETEDTSNRIDQPKIQVFTNYNYSKYKFMIAN